MREPPLPIPDDFVWPDYTGGTIANIPATIAALLGAPFTGLPPLYPSLWQPLHGRVKRVILLLVDALGWNLFQQELPRLEWLAGRAVVSGKITSVFPSTTVAALSSLWTGVAPAQHGLVGLRLFFPEYAVLGQLIKFTPNFISVPDGLVQAGVDLASFLAAPGFASQLATAGIPTYSLKGQHFLNSALSQMHNRGVVAQYGIVTMADLLVQLRELLEQTAGAPLYANAYWPAIDTLSHVYGPYHPSVAAELHAVLAQLKTELLDRLSRPAREGTALFIVGDHGQILSPPSQNVRLADHPELQQLLLMRPGGEPRAPYLFARQGGKAELLAALNGRLGEALVAFDAADVLAAGLLGPGPHAPETAARLGDIVATMRQGYLLLSLDEVKKVDEMPGRHGGMTAGEMEVPWLGFYLED